MLKNILQRMYDFVMKRKLTSPWIMTMGALLTFYAIGESAFITQQLGVLAWKVLVVAVGIKLAHFSRKQIFHYIDLSAMFASDSPNAGRVFIGIAIWYLAIIYAVAAGL